MFSYFHKIILKSDISPQLSKGICTFTNTASDFHTDLIYTKLNKNKLNVKHKTKNQSKDYFTDSDRRNLDVDHGHF